MYVAENTARTAECANKDQSADWSLFVRAAERNIIAPLLRRGINLNDELPKELVI